MLSLTPRFDLFEFRFPKDFFPQEVYDKYYRLINENQAVIFDPVNLVNESIQGITIPGINDIVEPQPQTSTNSIKRDSRHINREPKHDNFYDGPSNPLDLMDKDFTVTFRQNQGLLNYFIMYETLFHHLCKPILYNKGNDVWTIRILNEQGRVYSNIMLYQPRIMGIDGLDFSYSKSERTSETFDVKFSFNNLDFDFIRFKEKEPNNVSLLV